MTTAHTPTTWPDDVMTLAVDIGGSGIKASVVNAQAVMVSDRVRVDTPYPCPPELLVSTIADLVRPLPEVSRVSVGFPGLEKSSVTPRTKAHRSRSRLMNSGPLSTRIVLGSPTSIMARSSVATTSTPL